jgi:hypothetical protein
MDARYLAIYLNDHLAAATALLALLDRAIEGEAGGERGPFLVRVRGELAADRDTLKAVMTANGVRGQRPKLIAAWLAEKPGRLKFNGHLLRRSPLSPLVELETLALGLDNLAQLWRVLRPQATTEAAAARFDALIERAENRRAEVETHRLAAAAGVFPPARAG